MEIDVYIKELRSIIDDTKQEDDFFNPRSPTMLSSRVLDILEISKKFIPDHSEFIQSSKDRFRNIVDSEDIIGILNTILKWATVNEQSLVQSLKQTIEEKNQEIEHLKTRILAFQTQEKEKEKDSADLEKYK